MPTLSTPSIPSLDEPRASPRRNVAIAMIVAVGPAALLAAAVWMRLTELDHLPGVNGDEAWSGVQAMRIVLGDPFAWRTPTGNLINPFFLGPLVALHHWAAPSFTALRSVAAVSGLLALGLSYWLSRRLFGRRTATIVTVLLAVMPINIAYSRFAWDASQSLAATTLVIYPALIAVNDSTRRAAWLAAGWLGQVAAVLVHPTNVFVAPVLAVASLVCYWPQALAIVARCFDVKRRRWTVSAVALAGLLVGWAATPWIIVACRRMASLPEFLEFALNWVRLISGDTVDRYISGALRPIDPADGIPVVMLRDLLAIGLIAVALYGVRRLWQQRPSTIDAVLLGGTALTLAGFYLVAGPKAAGPHFERYSLCLVAPSALVLSRGIAWWLMRSGWRWPIGAIAWSLLAAIWLCRFYDNYFVFLRTTGGEAHWTFRTAAVEPKQQLFDRLLEQSAGQPQWLICPEWWIYWPLEYLALGGDSLRVVRNENELLSAAQSSASTGPRALASAQFFDQSDEREICSRLEQAGIAYSREGFNDFAGRPLISLLNWRENRLEKNQAPSFDNRQSRPTFQVPGRTQSSSSLDAAFARTLEGSG